MSSIVQTQPIRKPPHAIEQVDCLVIGAGVAGAFFARQIARFGVRTLLVDAKKFPRSKVCGSCLNQRGMRILEQAGLGESLRKLGGRSIHSMHLLLDGKGYRWNIPTMLSTQRSRLDNMLVEEAVHAGVSFLDGCQATVVPGIESQTQRLVELAQPDTTTLISAELVVAADGLTQSSLNRLQEFQTNVSPNARIGLHSLIDRSRIDERFLHGLTMAVTREGYVGIAPVDGDAVDFAAAIDSKLMKEGIRPPTVIHKLLLQNGIDIATEVLASSKWYGTPSLTRNSNMFGGHRMLLIGDSLGYVEPFTGEGMSWALKSASLAVDVAQQAVQKWDTSMVQQWETKVKQNLVKNRWFCRQFAHLLRKPNQARVLASICDWLPALRNWTIQKVSVDE